MSTVNLAVLDAALAHIEANPEQHEQRWWFSRAQGCGTAMCLAGTIAWQAGWKPISPEDWSTTTDDYGNPVKICALVAKDGVDRHVGTLARELLGLDGDDADNLFGAYNTLADLRRIRDELAERAL